MRDQHPQFETVDSSELDRPFLGGAIPDTPRPLTLSRRPEGWTIDSGAVHGVPEPIRIGDTTDTTELAIYPLSAQGPREPLATALVTPVLPDRSVVTVTPEIDPSSIYRAVVTSIPLKPLSVAVAGDAAGTAALRAAADNADSTLIDLVEASDGRSDAEPDLQVEATPGRLRHHPPRARATARACRGRRRPRGAHDRRPRARGPVAAPVEPDATRRASSRPTPCTSRVVTAEGRTEDGGTVQIAYAGEKPPRFTVTLENTTKVPLWAALLDLTDSYGIYTDAFAAGRVALGPGEKTSLELGGEVPDALWKEGTVTVTDRLVVVTSTIEFDPRSLQQGDLAVSAVPGRGNAAVAGGADDPLGVQAPLDPGADARQHHHETTAATHDRDDRGLAHQPHRRRDDATPA